MIAPLLRRAGSSALVALLLAASPAWAQSKAAQYRELHLADGRSVTAEILSTEATGLLLRIPQGTSLVSFEILRDMVPTDASAYEAQPRWAVHVTAPPEHKEALLETLQHIPALDVFDVAEPGAGINRAQAAKAAACGLDISCITGVFGETSWRWVVVGLPTDQGLRLVSRLTTGTTGARIDLEDTSPETLWKTSHELLMLQMPSGGPPRALRTPQPFVGGFDQQRVIAMSFTPVPGLPSLKQGDPTGFAAALGIVVPTTALWVGAVGQNAQSVPETAALGVVGFYAATVIANQVTGLSSMKRNRRAKRAKP